MPDVHLSFDCPHCRKLWSITARVRRDDECPRCGTVSLPVKARVLESWSDLSKAAWRPIPQHNREYGPDCESMPQLGES